MRSAMRCSAAMKGRNAAQWAAACDVSGGRSKRDLGNKKWESKIRRTDNKPSINWRGIGAQHWTLFAPEGMTNASSIQKPAQGQNSMLTLVYSPGSCALAPHIALEEAGATYDTKKISLRTDDQTKPEFLAI